MEHFRTTRILLPEGETTRGLMGEAPGGILERGKEPPRHESAYEVLERGWQRDTGERENKPYLGAPC